MTLLTATRLPNALVARRASSMLMSDLRRRMPSMPRGKNITTMTNIRPMKLIQFTVIDEM